MKNTGFHPAEILIPKDVPMEKMGVRCVRPVYQRKRILG